MTGIVSILECLVNTNSGKKYKSTYSMGEDRILHIVNQDRDAKSLSGCFISERI
jgi:hypothetical protein